MPKEILLPTTQPLLPEKFGFKTSYFDLPGGLRLHAAVAGPKDGPLAILLHGFPEFWFSWRRQMAALAAAGLRVVAPDQRGYNLSDKQGPYDIPTLVGDISALIEVCGRKQAFVAGHDWGAAVAWSLAILRPERVRKLAVLNLAHPYVMLKGVRGGDLRQMLKSWYTCFFQIPGLPEFLLSRDGFSGMRRMIRSSSRPGTFQAAELNYLAEAWGQPGALSAMLGWYRAAARLTLSRRRFQLAKKVTCPTLILWGEQDLALEVSLGVKSLDWCADGRMQRYPTASHWVQADVPEEINHELVAFFK